MTTIANLDPSMKARLVRVAHDVPDAFGYDFSVLEKVRGGQHIKPIRADLLSFTNHDTPIKDLGSSLLSVRIYLMRKRLGNPVTLGRAVTAMTEIYEALKAAYPEETSLSSSRIPNKLTFSQLAAPPKRKSDLEALQHMRDCNWKPASQYWKEQFEDATERALKAEAVIASLVAARWALQAVLDGGAADADIAAAKEAVDLLEGFEAPARGVLKKA